MKSDGEALYHVTTLSNFARAFDKYTRLYRKGAIPESHFPLESYLLPASHLGIGVAKASRLRDKLKIVGDELLVLQARVLWSKVRPNLRNGVGLVWPSPDLPISGLFSVGADGKLGRSIGLEEATAKSLALHAVSFASYSALRPRSVSFLPIARGCQAACPFCFSEASVSVDQSRGVLDLGQVGRWAELARIRGAERAVITGGGEPTLLHWDRLQKLVNACKRNFDKVVLITNGVRIAQLRFEDAVARTCDLANSGLSVLAISRHHHDEVVNAELMKLSTNTSALLKVVASASALVPKLHVRLICVLQRGGVNSTIAMSNYILWATSLGVSEICFKELYVATSQESVYYSRAANAWSLQNQVPLTVVHDWARENGFRVSDRLPWEAPIFSGQFGGKSVRIAAYTEPSLFWERSNGIARSWNVMSDGTCLASLEDRRSEVTAAVGDGWHTRQHRCSAPQVAI